MENLRLVGLLFEFSLKFQIVLKILLGLGWETHHKFRFKNYKLVKTQKLTN